MSDPFFDDLNNALQAKRPRIITSAEPTPSRKRTRTEANLPSDSNERSVNATSHRANRNLTHAARRIADDAKLSTQQATQLDEFTEDTLHVQNMKIYAALLALDTRLDRLAPPPESFTLSPDFLTNLKSYAHGVIFSSKIAMYKGNVPIDHLLEIVKRLRWGLPPGTEHDKAKWAKVKHEASEALTQVRRKIKIQLIASIAADDAQEHWSIYDLAKACVGDTQYKITVPLMARLALMRGVFSNKSNQGKDFWDKVDNRLVWVAETAKKPHDVARAFTYFLEKDRKTHGTGVSIEIDEELVDDLQENIDKAIDDDNRRRQKRPSVNAAQDEHVSESSDEDTGDNDMLGVTKEPRADVQMSEGLEQLEED